MLLHFAGCALASLHPDPLSSFTSRELAVEGEDEEQGTAKTGLGDGQDKAADFGKYAEAYYTTLNVGHLLFPCEDCRIDPGFACQQDIQVGLRTSIRHLRVTRTSPAPLLDPTFGSLASSSGPQPSQVGVGGLALADLLKPLDPKTPRWDGRNSRVGARETEEREKGRNKLSVAAKEFEKEAWKDLADALEGTLT